MTEARTLDLDNASLQNEQRDFDFRLRTRMVFGPDTIDQLGALCKSIDGTRILVVSDPGIVRAGHVERGLQALRKARVETALFDGAHENPTTDDVRRGVEFAEHYKPDMLVGLGGGSSMDCAKGINFIYTNGGQMRDYWGVGKAKKPMLPMVAVPTTAGTGSEMQSFALISDMKTHAKMACGDKKASCRIAILDPNLTLTQSPLVTALTGVDALSHALETFVTRPRNPVSIMYSRESWRLLASNFARVLSDGDDVQARGAMQLGAAYAGVAIENSMLGGAHSMANPLTAKYGTAHGQAVGAMLPAIIRYNGVECDSLYQELIQLIQGVPGAPEPSSGSEGLAEFVEHLVSTAGMQTKLQGLGVQREQIKKMAEMAAGQWTAQFNPRTVDKEAFQHLYEQSF